MSRSLELWLDDYGESHQNPTNKKVHWVCVPVIFWCVLALLWQVPLGPNPLMNAATVLIVFSILFYARLSWTLTIGMAVLVGLSVVLIQGYQSLGLPVPLWLFALVLFVVAWAGQFWGHRIEGRKPSFLKDIQFLLIGPAWLLSFVYQRLGIPLKG
jgi:uncharacterized membrane protein YGL010W